MPAKLLSVPACASGVRNISGTLVWRATVSVRPSPRSVKVGSLLRSWSHLLGVAGHPVGEAGDQGTHHGHQQATGAGDLVVEGALPGDQCAGTVGHQGDVGPVVADREPREDRVRE